VRRKTGIRSTVLEKFGVQLNLNTHRANRDGVEIRLTSKEFALLELFMMNPGKILSRELISENLWDMNFEPRSNIIESFMRILRNKLDRNFQSSLFHTVRGAGYMFSEQEP
jgi:two-component system copper resistance phosphate regulon response regulator CusR